MSVWGYAGVALGLWGLGFLIFWSAAALGGRADDAFAARLEAED